MAIYHLHTKTVARARGHSAVAAAAYRAGEKLHDARRGRTLDYSRRTGVADSFILAPDNAPAWMRVREMLWNTCEALETRVNSRTAREIEVALPRELDLTANAALVRSFAAAALLPEGMVADVAIHRERARDGGENVHAHILLTTRPVRKDGAGFGQKNRWWDSKDALKRWRAAWSEHVNRFLDEAGSDARVDHRTLAAQGVTWRAPTHLAHAAHVLETRRGVTTERGEQWRETRHRNGVLPDAPSPEALAVLAAAARLTPAQAGTHTLLTLASRALLGKGG